MGDYCPTKKVIVEVQENGIIRNLSGRIIGVLENGHFDDLESVDGEVLSTGKHHKNNKKMY
jgi:hypothetical protein